jgi:hypothetical protein
MKSHGGLREPKTAIARWARQCFPVLTVRSAHLTLIEKQRPVLSDEAGNSSIHLDIDTGTRPPDLNARLSMPAAFLDDYVTITPTSPDRQIAVAIGALFATQGADTVFVADPLGARRQREQEGGTCHCNRNDQDMSCSHLWSP